MENQNHKLPGISQLEFIECELLSPFLALKQSAGIPVAVFANATKINFFEIPVCDTKDEMVNNERVYTTTLKFKSNDDISTDKHLAFIIHHADGSTKLVGVQEPPYPTVTKDTTSGMPGGDASVSVYTVKYVSNQDTLDI